MRIYYKKDKLYPNKLKEIDDAPLKLYVLGELPNENKKTVAIVGARECSHYGSQMAYKYAQILADEGVQIVSGMARGIDSAAHRGALEAGGKTFAIMGCGTDICYPIQNRDLYEQIKTHGGVISEFENGEKPISWHFPMRNRIISALSDLILVGEARSRSGSLITADRALDYGKDVFAIPGRVGDSLSEGCNQLISQGAGIAWNPQELLVSLFHKNFQKKERVSSYNNKCFSLQENSGLGNEKYKQKNISGLESKEKKVYSCMGLYPIHVNEIVKITGLTLEEVMTALFSLEILDLVIETTKNYYAVR